MNKKRIYNIEELMDETPTMRVLGGLRGVIRKGYSDRMNMVEAFLQGQEWGKAQAQAGGDDQKIKAEFNKGFTRGKDIGTSEGFTTGVKRMMVEGDKYILLKSGEEPRTFPSFDKLFTDFHVGNEIQRTLHERELGNSFEESIYYQKMEDALKEDFDYISFDSKSRSPKKGDRNSGIRGRPRAAHARELAAA